MESTEDALRNAVAERPHDATPRLVLADYLDDDDRGAEATAHRIVGNRDKNPVPTVRESRQDMREVGQHLTDIARQLSWSAIGHTATRALGVGSDLGYGVGTSVRLANERSLAAVTAAWDPARAGRWGSPATPHLDAATHHMTLSHRHQDAAERYASNLPGQPDEGPHHAEGHDRHLSAMHAHEAAHLVHRAADTLDYEAGRR